MAYRIKSVAALTGITTATLRAWERRYGLVSPERSQGGYRLYSDEDVALFSRVKALVDGGLSASEAVTMVREDAGMLPLAEPSPEAIDATRTELLDSLLALDRTAADRAARALLPLPVERRMEEVLMPVLREIGTRWADGRASIVQEHFASAFVREKLVAVLGSLDGGSAGEREAVCAGAPGEMHELGLMAAAVHLGLRGWRVTYLGLDVPPPELGAVLESHRPALLCTSLISPMAKPECLQYARDLRAVAPPETTVVVGGAGVPLEAVGTPAPGVHVVTRMDELLSIVN